LSLSPVVVGGVVRHGPASAVWAHLKKKHNHTSVFRNEVTILLGVVVRATVFGNLEKEREAD
jgi:hypothetical protein